VSAHASAASSGAISSISRPQVWLGGFIALLAFAVWLGAGPANAAAAECPNEAIRIAQGATQLPGCRAYERVSPADSTGVIGVEQTNRPMFGAIRADGDAATFGSSTAVGDSERGASRTFNLAHRSATGWSSFGVLTTSQPNVPYDQFLSPWLPVPSADMSRMMFNTNRSLGPPDPVTGGGGSVYLSAPEGKGPPTWLSHWTREGIQPNPTASPVPLGGSPDLSRGFFRYSTPLTEIAGDDMRTSQNGLYYFAGNTIAPAGVLPSGTVSPQGALPAGITSSASTGITGNITEQARNEVSADGSKLLFVSPAEGSEPKQLYVQEGDRRGRLISHDAAGNPASAGVSELEVGVAGNASWLYRGFAFATSDGSRVLFRSTSALTDDAPTEGVKTYRASVTESSVEIQYLPAVTGYPMAIDRDASTILFATTGSIASTASFYVWDEDRLGGAPYTVASDVAISGSRPVFEPALTPDGETLVFTSGKELEPGVALLAEGGYTQVYRWTKQSDFPVCISCRRDGGTPARFGSRMGNLNNLATDNPAFPNTGGTMDTYTQSSVVGNRKVSIDGSRVFFDTSDPLDPARDVNGTRDIYMWENGRTYLLTSGRNKIPSLIVDSSTSGDDVILVTADGLIPSDTNQTYDVYDVRVDGGFAEPVKESCEGDACQGQGSGPPQAAVAASAKLAGSGNQHESRKGGARARKALPVTQLGRPGANSARVRIRVPAAGRVSIAGADVKNASRAVKRGGAVVIKVGLSSAGKRKLTRKGQLRTTVRVTFRPKSGATTTKTVKLSFAGPKGAR
jgi:hypothetical protein